MHKGLILGRQQDVNVDTEHWKFGIVRNSKKIVDPMLHYTAYPLAYNDHGIIDAVCENLKKYKPETGDNAFKAFEPTLNSPHIELSNKLYEMSNGYRSVYTLSGSDGIEVAIKLAFAYHEKKEKQQKENCKFYRCISWCNTVISFLWRCRIRKSLSRNEPLSRCY